jgi:type II pantothenate kinase
MNADRTTPEDVGLDIGATLAKVAAAQVDVDLDSAALTTFVCPARESEALIGFLSARHLRAVTATGAGARAFARLASLPFSVELADEFEAWGEGERVLLSRADFTPSIPHLLVSLGTGTSILRVDEGGRISRAGGTALGGGTLSGLARLLIGIEHEDHDAVAQLALEGDRKRVDLLVSDIYEGGEIALDTDLTASNFGRVQSPRPNDLAHALTRLVGENVGLLAGALAAALPHPAHERVDVVYAGSTVRSEGALKDILAFATDLAGARAQFLPLGAFTGAVGALARGRRTRDAMAL